MFEESSLWSVKETLAICSPISAVDRLRGGGGRRGVWAGEVAQIKPLFPNIPKPRQSGGRVSGKLERELHLKPRGHFGHGATHSLLPFLLLKVIRIWINDACPCNSQLYYSKSTLNLGLIDKTFNISSYNMFIQSHLYQMNKSHKHKVVSVTQHASVPKCVMH